MKAFFASVAFAIAAAAVVAFALNAIQQPSYSAFTTSGARVGDPGSNLVGAADMASGQSKS